MRLRKTAWRWNHNPASGSENSILPAPDANAATNKKSERPSRGHSLQGKNIESGSRNEPARKNRAGQIESCPGQAARQRIRREHETPAAGRLMKNTPRLEESQGAHYRITSSEEVIVEFPVARLMSGARSHGGRRIPNDRARRYHPLECDADLQSRPDEEAVMHEKVHRPAEEKPSIRSILEPRADVAVRPGRTARERSGIR